MARRRFLIVPMICAGVALIACASLVDLKEVEYKNVKSTVDSGVRSPDANPADAADDAAGCLHELNATVRDFLPGVTGHHDFEWFLGSDAFVGLVKPDLGRDRKPVYAADGGTSVSTGPTEFAQWYTDVPGVNLAIPIALPLAESPPGTLSYTALEFFPIDGRGFGNGPPFKDGTSPHNFSFTTEIHLSFRYNGGEVFSFRGDDDVWVFINGKLVIDLGGPHPELTGTVDLDAQQAKIGITKGREYPLDIFHAERHTDGSHFNISTTIKCLTAATPD